jgi:hypothetical protein
MAAPHRAGDDQQTARTSIAIGGAGPLGPILIAAVPGAQRGARATYAASFTDGKPASAIASSASS